MQMSGTEAVLCYLLWTLLLALLYAVPRVPQILLGKRAADSWERNAPVIDPPFLVRAKGAHLNCVENFPLFAALVGMGALLDRSAVVDAVAGLVLYARFGQSMAHLFGTSLVWVGVRATLFVAQVALVGYAAWQLLQPAA